VLIDQPPPAPGHMSVVHDQPVALPVAGDMHMPMFAPVDIPSVHEFEPAHQPHG
jgi:hypothetical protein